MVIMCFLISEKFSLRVASHSFLILYRDTAKLPLPFCPCCSHVNFSTGVQASSKTLYDTAARPLLDLLDNMTIASIHRAEEFLAGISSALLDVYTEAANLDALIRDACRQESLETPLYICHKADRINDKEVFNPRLHVQRGSLILLSVDGQFASTPWALARVNKGPYCLAGSGDALYVDVTYVLPQGVHVELRGVNRGKCGIWGEPSVWSGKKFVDWPCTANPKTYWEQDCVGVDSIWWGTVLTKQSTLFRRSKDSQILISQIHRIESAFREARRLSRLTGTVADTILPPLLAQRHPSTDPLISETTVEDDDDDPRLLFGC